MGMFKKEFNPTRRVFAGIDDVDPNGQRNPYLEEGSYVLEVESCRILDSRDKRTYYLVELKVIESDNDSRPADMMVTWMTDLDKDMGPVNVKRFIAAVNGIDPNSPQAKSEITEEICEFSISDDQPLKGMQVFCEVVKVETRQKTEFSEHRWRPLEAA